MNPGIDMQTSLLRRAWAPLLLAVSALSAAPTDARADVVAPPTSTCPATTVPPVQPGSTAGIPGAWYNPQRYGTAWNFLFTANNQYMVLFWYTFDAQGKPTWLISDSMPTARQANGDTKWVSKLWRVTYDFTQLKGVRDATPSGSVGVTFPNGTATRAALSWQWNPAGTGAHPECVYNTFRDIAPSDTSNAAKVAGAARSGSAATLAAAAAVANTVNESFTGHWYAPTQDGWGIDMTVGIDVFNNYTESFNLSLFDTAGRPAWIYGQSDGSAASPSMAWGPVRTAYVHSNYGIPTTDCATESCVVKTLLSNTSYQRSFSDATHGSVALSFNVPTGVTGGAAIQWPPAGVTYPVATVKGTDINDVIVSTTQCVTPAGQSTCSYHVGWSSTDAGANVVRRDLVTNQVVATIGSGAIRDVVESLPAGSYVAYELRSAGGSVLATSASVRVLGGDVPDAPVVSNAADLPVHDASVGAIAGEAGVDGGAASYRIPIVVPPGRAGMQPDLALSYSSRGGNGSAGLGWSLSGSGSIHRCPQTIEQDARSLAVAYKQSDRLCIDGKRLVPLDGNNGNYGAVGKTYRTEINDFSRITQVAADLEHGGSCFKVELKSGRILHFGGIVNGSTCTVTAASVTPNGAPAPLAWQLAKVEDRVGNNQLYSYTVFASGEAPLTAIDYTGFGAQAGNRRVVLSYGDRPSSSTGGADWASSYLAGGLTMQTKRLTQVDTYVGSEHVRAYKLDYSNATSGQQYSMHSGRSLLGGVTECAYDPAEVCRPRTTFGWTDFPVDHLFHPAAFDGALPAAGSATAGGGRNVSVVGDFDGDGSREMLVDQIESDSLRHFYLAKVNADRQILGTVEVTSLFGVNGNGIPLGDPDTTADIDSDGRADLIGPNGGSLSLYVSTQVRGAAFSGSAASLFRTVGTNIPWSQQSGRLTGDYLVGAFDADGDGYLDIVAVKSGGSCQASTAGSSSTLCIYRNVSKAPIGAATTSYSFSAGEAITSWASQADMLGQRFDVNGDGIPDILVNAAPGNVSTRLVPDKVLLSTSTGASGISACPAQAGQLYALCDLANLNVPKADLWRITTRFMWLDVNGDGLTDLVFADGGVAGFQWTIHLNTAKGFSAGIGVQGAQQALVRDGSGINFRYFGRTPVADVDGDGRAEILYPAALAARMCTFVSYQYDATQEGQCPEGGLKASTEASAIEPTSSTTCRVFACSEDPSGRFPLPTDVEGYGVVGTYSGHYHAAQFNFSGTDTSSYEMAAVRFVQTGPASFEAVSVSLDATQNIAKRAAHRVIANLDQVRASVDDLYGDGLSDLPTQIGCRWSPVPRGTIDNHCVALADDVYGPHYLPDGTDVATLAGAASPFAFGLKLYVNENVGAWERAGAAPAVPELVRTVADGLGRQTLWDYYPLGSNAYRAGSLYPLLYSLGDASYAADSHHYYFTSSMPVVSSMVQSAGQGGAITMGFRSWSYGYEGAIYNHLGRGFQGFRKILQNTATLGNAADLARRVRVETTYHQKFPLAGQLDNVRYTVPPTTPNPSGVPLLGQPNQQGALFKQETYKWGCDVSNRYSPCATDGATPPLNFPYLIAQQTWNYDLAKAEQNQSSMSTAVSLVSTLNYYSPIAGDYTSGWDANGNLQRQQVVTQDLGYPAAFVDSHKTITQSIYTPADTAGWWLDRLQSRAVTTAIAYNAAHPLPAGVSAPDQTVTTAYQWNNDRTLASEDVQIGVAGQHSSKVIGYPTPSYGLPSSMIVSGDGVTGSRSSGIAYSPDGYFVQTTTNALNQSSQAISRARDGQVTSATDPNGVTAISSYDAFGLGTRVDYRDAFGNPSQPSVFTAVNACSGGSCTGVGEGSGESYAKYRVTTVRDGAPTAVVWYDQLGRVVKKAARGFDGTFTQQLTEYDYYGTMTRQSQPHFAGDSVYWTTMNGYDRSNRLLSKTAPAAEMDPTHGDLTTTYSYVGNRVDIAVKGSTGVCNVANVCVNMSRSNNALGQVMDTIDAKMGLVSHWFDAAGRSIAFKDAKGLITRSTYNELGHRLTATDPDMGANGTPGTWTYTYNALGEMVTQADARGVTLTVNARDALGRVTTQTSSGFDPGFAIGPESFEDSWSYDQGSFAIGQLSSVVRKRNGAQVWKEDYAFDAAERPVTVTTTMENEPVAMVTQRGYDGYYGREKVRSYPSGLRVQTLYSRYGVAQEVRNPDSAVSYSTLTAMDAWGHPTAETFGNGLTGAYDFYRSTGQSKQRAWSQGGVAQDSIAYTYDTFSNLTRQARTSAGTTSWEDYGYDALQRLTAGARSSGQGSIYSYDASGNFLSKSDYASSYNYQFGNNQVTSIYLAAGGSMSYAYDRNGNLVSSNGTESAFGAGYDAANLMRWAQRGSGYTKFSYSPAGERYQELTSTGLRTSFGPAGVEKMSNGSWRHELGSAVVLRNSAGNDTVTYIERDRLGSTLAMVEPSFTDRRTYDPFGKSRNGDQSDRLYGLLNWNPIAGVAPSRRGFTEHEHLDEVQLIHMNGRAYDYNLGRFLSVDPVIQFPTHSQSLNPYSYITNNPLSGTDPTGYQACTGSHIDRGPGTDCAEQGVDTTEVNSPQAAPGARLQRSGTDRQTAHGATSTPTGNSASDIGTNSKAPAQHDPSRASGRSDDATGLDQIVVTPRGAHLREYRVAYELDLYPAWLVAINAWRDRAATAIVNHDAAQIGKMLGKGAASAGFCAATAGGCVLMGAYNTAGDIEQGNYVMAVVDGGMTVAGASGVATSVRGAGGTTTLYRAVGPAELADINSTGSLRNLGSAEGKYFTTSAADASAYAKQAVKAFGDAPYTTIRTEVPNTIFRGLSPATVDGGIPAWVIPDSRLPGLRPQVLDHMALPSGGH